LRIPRKEEVATNKKKTPIIQSAIQTSVFWNKNSSDTSGLIRLAIPNNKVKALIKSERRIIKIFVTLDTKITGYFMI